MMPSNPTATARNTYYHRHQRGFWNECDIIRCEDAEDQALAESRGFERITRAELERHIRDINTRDAGGNWAPGRTGFHIDAQRVFAAGDRDYAAWARFKEGSDA